MKKLTTLIVLIIFSSTMILATNPNEEKENTKNSESAVMTTSVSGKVLDKITGEALVGVKVMVDGTGKATYTDFDGNFEIANIKPGNHELKASYISYKETKENIEVRLEKLNEVKLAIENISE
ncbi:MAG: carboxypeptidase-like regulatory domain-containing protein [Thiohalospira sp.]